MEILITNDDGWGAYGITLLAKLMTRLGHVIVVAPDGPRSSQSNAISMGKTLTLDSVSLKDNDDFTQEEKDAMSVYITNGTPSDCVKLAMHVLFDSDPSRIDLLVSGINHGSNASISIIYSGTMGACFVAAEHGIKAIGYSLCDLSPEADFSYFAPYILDVTKHLLDTPWLNGMSYNVNAPLGEINGIRWTRQCRGHWDKEMEAYPVNGKDNEYRLTGYFVNDEPESEDTDEWALAHGYISIQPCSVDMTCYEAL